MGPLDRLRGQLVGLDTSPLIYFIERHPSYFPIVRSFFGDVVRGEIQAVTSILTLTEVLVHPVRQRDLSLATRYTSILLYSENLVSIPVTDEIATEAARIRANHRLKTPDAIQLATALLGGATTFLTNDDKFASIPGLEVIQLDRLANLP